jgi:alpha-tubulin suppressor-like RCC1 family protein
VVSLSQVTQLAVGGNFACAMLAGGSVSCWGNNDFGQLGDGTRVSRSSPQLVPGLTGIVQISAGNSDACAVTNAGALLCWGDGLAQIYGAGGSPDENRLTPTPVRF